MSERILVAGGAGFIGSHLIKHLLGIGNDVICVDNLSTGLAKNLSSFRNHPKFTFIEQDICTPLDIQIDAIYNLACPASPLLYQAEPIQTIKSSVVGTLQLADLALKCGAKIFLSSTSEIYGNPSVHPQPETYLGNLDPTSLRACYDEGKRCAETILFDYHRQHGLEVKVARLFNTYGPHLYLSDGRVVPRFISQALHGQSLTVFGDGSQTRSFCFIDDQITAITRMMETGKDFLGPINLGNPHEITVNELAEIIIQKCGSKSKIGHEPLRADDPTRRCPDIGLAKQVLSWEPRVSIDEGLDQTIAWYRREIDTAEAI